MLRATVGLSRKFSRDFNSTGYSINLDGEIPFSVDDPEAVTEKIRELFNLAQEALAQEMDRDLGEDAIGRRDEDRPTPTPEPKGTDNSSEQSSHGSSSHSTSSNGSGLKNGSNGQATAATNKQVQFLLNMGKRFKLSTPQLESRIAEIIGRRCGVYDLSKKEAGLVLEHFTKAAEDNGNSTNGGRQGR